MAGMKGKVQGGVDKAKGTAAKAADKSKGAAKAAGDSIKKQGDKLKDVSR
jgi:hypothetical protein